MLPFYNEESNAETVIDDALRVLNDLSGNYETIAVNDGSSDATRRIRPLHHKADLGYGAALRSGIAAASGEWNF